MASENEPDLRNQLIEARANILAQLDELNDRAIGMGRTHRDAPPRYSSVIAELEGQLSEIDALLGTKDESDA
jgi:hypothetical protein